MMTKRSYISDRVKVGAHKWMQRSLMRTAGMTQEQMERPLIGIASSWTDLFQGHANLDKLAKAAADGVLMAGGTPVTFSTIAICDGIAMGSSGMKYSLPSRDLIADCIESMAEAHGLDGLILVPACDKIIPGMVMGMLRLNIPAIVVTGGPSIGGCHGGERFDGLSELAKAAYAVDRGEMDIEEEYMLEEIGVGGATCGSCTAMATANSLGCMTEALGIGVPGNGAVPAPYSERLRMAKRAGIRLMELVEQDIKPRDIVTRESFLNAIRLDMMLGCSTNTALHLPALADEAHIKISIDDFDAISRQVPQIVKISPANSVLIEDLHRAGGISAVIKQAMDTGMFDGSQKSVMGKTIGELVESANVYDPSVIRPMDDPHTKEGGLFILKGNLAPDGCVIKVGGVPKEMMAHSGPARVFNSERYGFDALVNHRIDHGDVMVIRYEGPKGGPGMQEMLSLTEAVVSYGYAKDVALITDGRFSGATVGAAVGHIAPEAAMGGLIGLVEDGDIIAYDINKREINLMADEETIKARRAKWVCPPPKVSSGWLARYAQLSRPVCEGATLKADCELN